MLYCSTLSLCLRKPNEGLNQIIVFFECRKENNSGRIWDYLGSTLRPQYTFCHFAYVLSQSCSHYVTVSIWDSANMDLICQAKERSYPWTNKYLGYCLAALSAHFLSLWLHSSCIASLTCSHYVTVSFISLSSFSSFCFL